MGLVTIGEGQGDKNAVGVKCNPGAESWKRNVIGQMIEVGTDGGRFSHSYV